MNRSTLCCAALVCASAACTVADDRPETLAYVTETVLAPSCGTAECHSAMKAEHGYVFDSVAAAQRSIASYPLILTCSMPPCEGADQASYLITVISQKDSYGNRMPLDQPLANKDIVYLANWIADGAEGYVPPTAPTDGN